MPDTDTDKSAIVQELYNRMGSLSADKQAIVQELARRYNVNAAAPAATPAAWGAAPDPAARMHADALSKIPRSLTSDDIAGPGSMYVPGGMSVTPVPVPFDMAARGGQQVVRGVEHMAAPGLRAKVGGAADVAEGAMQAAAPLAVPVGLLTNPVGTVAGLAGGTVAGKVAYSGLKAAGVPEEYAHAGSVVAGLAGGTAAAHYAPGAIAAAPGAVADAASSAADALRASAIKNYETAINPTTKVNKALVQNKIAPGLVDRGVTATSLDDLQGKMQAAMEQHGQTINDIFDKHAEAGTTISPKPILSALDAEKQNYTVAGVPINEPYVAKLESFQKQIQAISDAHADDAGGQIPLSELRKVRDAQSEIVAQSKGGFALPPDAQSSVNASKLYGNAIRSTFADSVPELVEPNREFNFAADADKVIGDSLLRKTGQRAPLTQKLGELAGTTVGAHVGGVPGALVLREAGGQLGKLQNSTIFNSLSAQMKMRVANLLSAGDEAGAARLLPPPLRTIIQSPDVPVSTSGTAAAAADLSKLRGQNAGEIESGTLSSALPASGGTGASTAAGARAAGATATGPADTTVSVPGQSGGGYRAQYKLKELADLNASHNGQTFARNAEYSFTNDRDYQNAVNQGKIISGASPSEFNPALHLTDNPDAGNGPLVVDSQGNVLGGNGRKMMLDRVNAGNPKGAAAYRSMLEQKAGQFGIDPADVRAMKTPVLVREVSDAELEAKAGGAQRAITDFNKVGTAALTPAERAISDSRRVSAGTLDDLGGRLDAKGADATLAQALDGRGGVEVLNNLIKDGVVSPQERAAFASSDELTAAGRDRVSKLVLGRFFDSPEQLDTIPASIRGKVERLAAPLAQVEGRGEWSLTEPMRDALGILHQADRLGVKNVDDFLQQDGLFGKDKYSPEAVRLAQVLQKMKSTDVQAAARQYAQDAAFAAKGSNSLLGAAPTPAESFRDAFGKAPANALAPAETTPARAPAPGAYKTSKDSNVPNKYWVYADSETGGRMIGSLSMFVHGDELRVGVAGIGSKYHGQGRGTAMYLEGAKLADKLGKRFTSSNSITPAAARVWQSLGASLVKDEYGTHYVLESPGLAVTKKLGANALR